MAAILLATSLLAQHNEEVTVEGTYRPKVNKVDKIKLRPVVPTPTFSMPSSEVVPKTTDRKFDIELEKLSATAYSGMDDPQTKAAQNFLMAGLGTRISPLFLYCHDSHLTNDVDFGMGISHLSSWLDMKDHPASGFMNNLFDARLLSKTRNHQLSGRVFYKNDLYHYYGYRLSDSLIPQGRVDELCPKVVENAVGLNAVLSSTDRHLQQLQHRVAIDYRYVFGKESEHYADLCGKLAWADNWWGDRACPQEIGLSIGVKYDDYRATAEEHTYASHRLLVDMAPYLETKSDFYSLHLGFRFDYTSSDSVKVCFRPDVKGSLFVFDRKLELYANLGGGKQLRSSWQLMEENPFVSARAYQYDYQDVKLSFRAGLRTTVAEKVGLHLGLCYDKVKNDVFFVQDPNSMAGLYGVFNQYTIQYDNTETVSVVAETGCKVTEDLSAELFLAYNHIQMENGEHAWYRPAFEGRMKVEYAFGEQLAFNASLLYRNGIYANVYENFGIWNAVKLNDIIDLSIGADYKLNDQLALFAKLDNLTNCKYQLYYGYPVTGMQFFAGAKMTF